jgi:hypothetical protein
LYVQIIIHSKNTADFWTSNMLFNPADHNIMDVIGICLLLVSIGAFGYGIYNALRPTPFKVIIIDKQYGTTSKVIYIDPRKEPDQEEIDRFIDAISTLDKKYAVRN